MKNDGLTFYSFKDSTTFQSRGVRSKSIKIMKFAIFAPLIFFNCDSPGKLTDDSAYIYDRKTNARRFGTFNDIKRSLSVGRSLLKGRKAPN